MNPRTRDWRRYGDMNSMADAAADLLILRIQKALKDRGRAAVALAGGSAPKALNRGLLRHRDKEILKDCDWFFGDDRAVGPLDSFSNYRMQKETLFQPGNITENRIHRIPGERGAQEAAADYAAELQAFFEGAVRFDVILLGLGPDGHCASLFPGSPALESDDAVIAAPVPPLHPQVPRITLGYTVLNAAYCCAFFTGSAGKESVLKDIAQRAPGGPAVYPAERVHLKTSSPIWFVQGEYQ